VISDENGCENLEDLSTLTKEKVFSIVGELWFENSPKLFEFLTDYMSIEGAKVFTLEHAVFASHFPRWFANVVARCPHIDARAYMIENMYVEEVADPTEKTPHYESLSQFGLALGGLRFHFNHLFSIVNELADLCG